MKKIVRLHLGMTNRKMRLLSLWLLSLCGAAQGEPPFPPGFCSQKCGSQTKENLLPCSCSSSCAVYKDCCFDSRHRSADMNAATASKMCISLSKKGRFFSVSGCPSSWSRSGQFCRESIGYLPPVTSATSGITYANIYCAVCNGDGEKLTKWNVELRCCPEHEHLDGRRYVYRGGHLWSKVENHRKCLCNYVAHNNDTSFTNSLELRSCDRSPEISRCSSSWDNDAVKELCKAFVDSVYIDEKIYKNIYCAKCNYQSLDQVKCKPSIVERMLSEGFDMASIFEYCSNNHLSICLHYFDHLHRGKSYTFSSLLNIREEGCLPPPGKRCCADSRYDFRTKRCRQLVRSSGRRIHV